MPRKAHYFPFPLWYWTLLGQQAGNTPGAHSPALLSLCPLSFAVIMAVQERGSPSYPSLHPARAQPGQASWFELQELLLQKTHYTMEKVPYKKQCKYISEVALVPSIFTKHTSAVPGDCHNWWNPKSWTTWTRRTFYGHFARMVHWLMDNICVLYQIIGRMVVDSEVVLSSVRPGQGVNSKE